MNIVSCDTYEAISVYPQAPVSGSKKPAEDGTLIFLTAGEYYSSKYLFTLAMEKSWWRIIFLFLQEGNLAGMYQNWNSLQSDKS